MKRTWATDIVLNYFKWLKPLYLYVLTRRLIYFDERFDNIELKLKELFYKAHKNSFKEEHSKLKKELKSLLDNNKDIIEIYDEKNLHFYYK